MRTWHKRAEAVCCEASALDLAVSVVKAERSKGSEPTVRVIPEAPKNRPNESIAMRRIRRLKANVFQQRQKHGGGAALDVEQRRHWKAFVKDQVVACVSRVPVNQAEAAKVLDAAVANEDILGVWCLVCPVVRVRVVCV